MIEGGQVGPGGLKSQDMSPRPELEHIALAV
jgi:hypothetical protein